MIDALGRTVKQYTDHNGSGFTNHTIDISHISTGTYLIYLKAKNNNHFDKELFIK